jgi:hypothetical protein
VVAIDDLTTDVADKTAHSIAHGVVRLEGWFQLTAQSGGGCA